MHDSRQKTLKQSHHRILLLLPQMLHHVYVGYFCLDFVPGKFDVIHNANIIIIYCNTIILVVVLTCVVDVPGVVIMIGSVL